MGQGVFKSQAATLRSAPRAWQEARRVPGQGHFALSTVSCQRRKREAVLCPWTQEGAPLEEVAGRPVGSTAAAPRASERSPPSLPLAGQVAIGAEGKAVRAQGALASAHCWVREPPAPSAGWEPPVEGGGAEAWMRCPRGRTGRHGSSDSKLGLWNQMKSGDLSSTSCPGCVLQPVASLCLSPRAHGAAAGRTGLRVYRAQKCLACGRCPCVLAVIVGHGCLPSDFR